MTYDTATLKRLIDGLPRLFKQFDASMGGWVSVLSPASITRYSFREGRQICHICDFTQSRIGRIVPPPEDKLPTDSILFGFRIGPACSFSFIEEGVPKVIKLGTIVYLEVPLDMPVVKIHPRSDVGDHTNAIQTIVVGWLATIIA